MIKPDIVDPEEDTVVLQNQLVNIVEFLSMHQDTEEPVSMFVSRLRGQAKVCEFSVQCPKEQCKTDVSYAQCKLLEWISRNHQKTEFIVRRVLEG